MSTCKKCGAEVVWNRKPDGSFAPPQNPDGSRHNCGGDGKPTAGAIIGLLTGYNSGSATVRIKGGASKTYALHGETFKARQTAGYGPDQWIEFAVDKNGFIQPGARNIAAPEWASELKDPTGGEIKTPAPKTQAEEKPQETPCTSPAAAAPEAPPALSDEDRIRAAVSRMTPSDRVGCRISLAGMVNSVIEIKKTHGKPIDTEEVKREAVALFLWCDSLTTRAVQ